MVEFDAEKVLSGMKPEAETEAEEPKKKEIPKPEQFKNSPIAKGVNGLSDYALKDYLETGDSEKAELGESVNACIAYYVPSFGSGEYNNPLIYLLMAIVQLGIKISMKIAQKKSREMKTKQQIKTEETGGIVFEKCT